jgi:hypothetical protein
MRIKIVGDNDCARATRGLLRQAGFAVSEFLPEILVSGYTVEIELTKDPLYGSGIYLDSVESPLEHALLRHVSQLWKHSVIVDRNGGKVHSDREVRIVLTDTSEAQHAVEHAVVRALLDMQTIATGTSEAPVRQGWWKRTFGK